MILMVSRAVSQDLYIIGHLVEQATGRQVPGAEVYIMGKDSISYKDETDEHGYFRLQNIRASVYNVHTVKEGYHQSQILNFDPITHNGLVLKFELCKVGNETESSLKKHPCPEGHAKCKVVPIWYGLHDAKDSLRAERGKAVLGGHSFNQCQPRWFCTKDSLKF